MFRPVIGITTPNKRFHAAYQFIKFSVWLCGGRPVALKSKASLDRDDIQGLVLGGGTDVFPGLYQSDPKQNYFYDHDRDTLELAWLDRAEERDIPVFAICRGAQMINVRHKGTLHLDVSKAYENAIYPRSLIRKMFFRKGINIKDNSLFQKLTGKRYLRVNSMHTQSIDKVGKPLIVTAQEENQVVQAVERHDKSFYFGVQFHPEFMIYRPSMRALFRGLIDEAKTSQL